MNDKSHVTMISRICVACGEQHDTGELALHKQLKQVFDQHTVVGFGLCDKCLEKAKEVGGVWLFSTSKIQDTVSLENAICVNENFLRDCVKDFPETPRQCCECNPKVIQDLIDWVNSHAETA